MTDTIIGAIIGAVGIAVGAIISKINFKGIFDNKKYDKITGVYESKWAYPKNPDVFFSEKLTIDKQEGKDISGYMLVESEPQKRWDFKGIFNDKYLEFYYYPSRTKSEDKLFEGYGCYFLVKQTDGTFRGYSTGIDERTGGMGTAAHSIKRVSLLF